MDQRLSKLIRDYQNCVAAAVKVLKSGGIGQPSSNSEWAFRHIPYMGVLPDDFRYVKHGYGCEVFGPEWRVDFDFGAKGEIDGFDAWRLHDFAKNRKDRYGFLSETDIRRAVDEAYASGELEYFGYILYYLSS